MTGRLGDATAVVVVSLHRRMVTTTVVLPSRWEHTNFDIKAEYNCQVVDAALVLQFGCWDVRPDLQRYLTVDPTVRVLAASADPFDYAAFRLRLGAHALARNRISPPYVPGMVCDLAHLTIEIQHGPPETNPATKSETEPAIDHPNGSSPNGHTGRAPQDYFWDG